MMIFMVCHLSLRNYANATYGSRRVSDARMFTCGKPAGLILVMHCYFETTSAQMQPHAKNMSF